jgi:hypothetical protein
MPYAAFCMMGRGKVANSISVDISEKERVEKLKAEWKQMWSDRFDDKQRAEGVSIEHYPAIQVDRGTIIHATRTYKAMDFREVLEQNNIKDTDRFVQPHKQEGGWNKFTKTQIIPNSPQNQRLAIKRQLEADKKKTHLQPNQNKKGWLHLT